MLDTREKMSSAALLLGALAVAPPPAASAQSAAGDGVTVQQTADGHAVLSFPVNVLRGPDLVDTIQATFDFGDSMKGLDKPIVSADKSIIAVANYPATKTSYVSLFLRDANGGLIAINSLNLQVGKFLAPRWASAAQSRLEVKSISGRVLSLAAFDYDGPGNQAEEYDFKLSVGADGALKLLQ